MARTPKASRTHFGTVEKLPSGRHRAYYKIEGERFNAPRTFPTVADARDWLAAEQADRARGVWHDRRASSVRFADYAQTWLEGRTDLAPRTYALYRDVMARYLLAPLAPERGRAVDLGRLDLEQLTPSVVRAWHSAVVTTARAASELRAERSAARGVHPARAWALTKGMTVAKAGRLSPELLAAWHRAGSPAPVIRTARGHEGERNANAGSSPATQAYRLLRTILATAVEDRVIVENPCKIKGAGQAKAARRTPATPAQVEALAAAMPARRRAALLIAAWSGLRYGELFALARRHVDLEAGTVRVERALERVPGEPVRFGPPKTDGSRRTVHLPAFVVASLREHMAEYTAAGANALVFTMPSGIPVSSNVLSADLRRAQAATGIEGLRWHDLRHTGATLAYAAGASVPDVQARLGHSTMRAAAIYAHTAADSDRVLADRLDALVASQAAPTRHLQAVPA